MRSSAVAQLSKHKIVRPSRPDDSRLEDRSRRLASSPRRHDRGVGERVGRLAVLRRPAFVGRSAQDGALDLTPFWKSSVAGVSTALVVKIVAAVVVAKRLGVPAHVGHMGFLPILSYGTDRVRFVAITSRSTLAMVATLAALFAVTLVRHPRQQRIAGAAVGGLAATNGLLIDLVLERRWGSYVEWPTARWTAFVVLAAGVLVATWFVLDRPLDVLRDGDPVGALMTS